MASRTSDPRRRGAAWIAHLAVVAVGLVIGWGLALAYRPVPISDFAHYWLTASVPAAYAKGGAWILVLMPLKALGLAPHVAAAVVHTGAWLGLAWVLWLPGGSRWGQAFATAVLAALAVWCCGFWGLVANDIPHVAFTAVGVTLGVRTWRDARGSVGDRRVRLLTAIVITGLGLSIRMQSMPVAALVAVVAALFAWSRDRRAARGVVGFAVGAIALAVVIETAMRAPSTQPLALYNRVSLYTGLLATEPGPACGRWTEAAAKLTLAELDQPFASVVRRRLADKWPEVPAIVACKLRQYVAYTAIGVPWLSGSLAPSTDGRVHRPFMRSLRLGEAVAGWALKLLLLGGFLASVRHGRGRSGRGLAIALVLATVLGYVALHAVVEIQPRYVVEPTVFGLVAIVLGSSWSTTDRSRRDATVTVT